VVHELELEIIPKMGEKTYLISKNIKRRIVMCRLWPGGQSQPKPAVKSQAKLGFLHGFPKPLALALIFESRGPWLKPWL
jgi:hypothetical protein